MTPLLKYLPEVGPACSLFVPHHVHCITQSWAAYLSSTTAVAASPPPHPTGAAPGQQSSPAPVGAQAGASQASQATEAAQLGAFLAELVAALWNIWSEERSCCWRPAHNSPRASVPASEQSPAATAALSGCAPALGTLFAVFTAPCPVPESLVNTAGLVTALCALRVL